MRKSSFANATGDDTKGKTSRIGGGIPVKTDRFPNQIQGVRGKNALSQTASLREFLGSKLPRQEPPLGLLTAIKEKIKARQ